MGFFSKAWILPLAMLLCIPGSGCRRDESAVSFVTRVDIVCRQGRVIQERHYTSSEKIEPVLNYLRTRENLGPPETDPERVLGDNYTVFVEMSDGRHHVYRQWADRYFSRDSRPWQKINPSRGCDLYYLLQTMPSD